MKAVGNDRWEREREDASLCITDGCMRVRFTKITMAADSSHYTTESSCSKRIYMFVGNCKRRIQNKKVPRGRKRVEASMASMAETETANECVRIENPGVLL